MLERLAELLLALVKGGFNRYSNGGAGGVQFGRARGNVRIHTENHNHYYGAGQRHRKATPQQAAIVELFYQLDERRQQAVEKFLRGKYRTDKIVEIHNPRSLTTVRRYIEVALEDQSSSVIRK